MLAFRGGSSYQLHARPGCLGLSEAHPAGAAAARAAERSAALSSRSAERFVSQNEYRGPMRKMKCDPRPSGVGIPFRRRSIDELP